MKTFNIRTGTQIFSNDIEIILRRGVIHKNELIINIGESSKEFVEIFKELTEKKSITLSSENSVYNDLETLLKFGFLTTYDSQGVRALLVIEDNLPDIAKNYFHGEIDIISSSEFFLVKELQLLVENKDILKITKLAKEKEEILKDFNHVYLVSNISNISLLRGFNKLMQLINQVNTIAFFDNENVFISCIEHGETGCYECLEQQLLTHFEGLASDYLDVPENNVSTAELLFVIWNGNPFSNKIYKVLIDEVCIFEINW
ncbi:bacteriocin biosynthesis cyclodehydratase, partial [Listeria seeligeri]|uniref:bacteriocin biosynthesis cyclodehydratase n=1 Tax=Listeria seeligeri TaxID=1640 RepID=UPI0018877777